MDNTFKVTQNGQTYNYRKGQNLNLEEVRTFFLKDYVVESLEQNARYVVGKITKDNNPLILKLATTQGISITLQNEFKWNQEYNISSTDEKLRVPKNVASGTFNGLFFLITERIQGEALGNLPGFDLHPDFSLLIGQIVVFSEHIMDLPVKTVGKPDLITGNSPQEFFVNKTQSWFDAIPEDIRNQNNINSLLEIVKVGASVLASRTRHGDFTPWHLLKTEQGLALLDGEHAMSGGVENYDIGYLIQRVHTVSNNPNVALQIYQDVSGRGYDKSKLKTVLAARAIGGYLDAFLNDKTDYNLENSFRDWVISL